LIYLKLKKDDTIFHDISHKKIDENEKFKMKLFNLTNKFHEHSDGIIANSKKLI